MRLHIQNEHIKRTLSIKSKRNHCKNTRQDEKELMMVENLDMIKGKK